MCGLLRLRSTYTNKINVSFIIIFCCYLVSIALRALAAFAGVSAHVLA